MTISNKGEKSAFSVVHLNTPKAFTVLPKSETVTGLAVVETSVGFAWKGKFVVESCVVDVDVRTQTDDCRAGSEVNRTGCGKKVDP